MTDEIDVVETRGENDVRLDVPSELAAAIGTASLARAEYFEHYASDTLAGTLRDANRALNGGPSHEPSDVTIPYMEHVADAAEWFARELLAREGPDLGRIEEMFAAADAMRDALDVAREQFKQATRDGTGEVEH